MLARALAVGNAASAECVRITGAPAGRAARDARRDQRSAADAWLLLAAGAALLAAAFLVYRRLTRPRAGAAHGFCPPSPSRAAGVRAVPRACPRRLLCRARH